MPNTVLPPGTIRSGQDLLLAFETAAQLGAEVASRQVAAHETLSGAIGSISLMAGTTTVLSKSQETKQCVEAVIAARAVERSVQELAALDQSIDGQVTGKRVLIENLSKGEKPVSIYTRHPDEPLMLFGRPRRRHRASGTIIEVNLSQNELIVKPRRLSPRGILRDYWRVAMLDDKGDPLVHVELR